MPEAFSANNARGHSGRERRNHAREPEASTRTRREILAGAIAGAATAGTLVFAKAAQPQTPLNFQIPQHACDCHTHIYGDPTKFPLSPERVYTPETALPEEMSALHKALHIERVVIVTPSVYGAANSATLYGIKARGQNARGVAVIDRNTSDSDLESMRKAGIRGIRINAATGGTNDPVVVGRRLEQLAGKVRRYDWHIQIYTNLAVISGIRKLVEVSPVQVVFDHFGGTQAELGPEQPGFSTLVELVRSGQAYVKISGAYLASSQAPDYPDLAPIAQALISANADRILWGSDWPHPNSAPRAKRAPAEVTPFRQVDDASLLNQLAVWEPDPAIRQKILVDNPARLYGF
jgi:predicted TIM-barrel fold metal-dependent hydrolase